MVERTFLQNLARNKRVPSPIREFLRGHEVENRDRQKLVVDAIEEIFANPQVYDSLIDKHGRFEGLKHSLGSAGTANIKIEPIIGDPVGTFADILIQGVDKGVFQIGGDLTPDEVWSYLSHQANLLEDNGQISVPITNGEKTWILEGSCSFSRKYWPNTRYVVFHMIPAESDYLKD